MVVDPGQAVGDGHAIGVLVEAGIIQDHGHLVVDQVEDAGRVPPEGRGGGTGHAKDCNYFLVGGEGSVDIRHLGVFFLGSVEDDPVLVDDHALDRLRIPDFPRVSGCRAQGFLHHRFHGFRGDRLVHKYV